MSLNVTVISPEVAAGDRDVSVLLEVRDSTLVIRFTRMGAEFELPLLDLEKPSVAQGVEQNLAVVLKELTS